MRDRKKKTSLFRNAVIVSAVVCLLCGLGFSAVVSNGYQAQQTAYAALAPSDDVTTIVRPDGSVVFAPGEVRRGLIFYPGGLVDERAYAPLMQRLAQDGTLCVLLKLRAQLAILDPRAADGVQAAFPQIDDWYIGGHSLGGYAAANYAAKHPQDFAGILLLAAYSGADLSGTELRAACVYGSLDGVMNRTRYEKGLSLLPADTEETVIEGGNHSLFGDYGLQKKDGAAAITAEEQLNQTAAAFLRLCGKSKPPAKPVA